MKIKQLQIKGMNKLPSPLIEPGYCEEMINMWHKDGVLRPRGLPQIKSGIAKPAGSWTNIWLHVHDNIPGEGNVIAYNSATGLLSHMDAATGAKVADLKTYTAATVVRVETMKTLLVALSDTEKTVWKWKDGAYVEVKFWNATTPTYEPFMEIYHTSATYTTDLVSTSSSNFSELILAAYYEKVDEASQANYNTGAIMVRFAYRLFDGSYFMPSIPKLVDLSEDLVGTYKTTKLIETVTAGVTTGMKMSFVASKLTISGGLLAYYYDLDPDIVTSVCVFASKAEDYFKIDSDTIDNDLITNEFYAFGGAQTKTLDQCSIPVSSKWKQLADSASWYKIHEVPIKDLQTAYVDIWGRTVTTYLNHEIDMKGYYNGFAVKETLPVDSFTHHQLTGSSSFVYNDRLMLGNTTTIFGYSNLMCGAPNDPAYGSSTAYPGYIAVTINTDQGEIIKYTPCNFNVYTYSGTNYIYFQGSVYGSMYSSLTYNYLTSGRGVIGYPDARATKISILITNSGNYHNFGEFLLTKSNYDNYAYFANNLYAPIYLSSLTLTGSGWTDDPTTADTLTDANRVQASSLVNPFTFPAANSYQIGVGTVKNICTPTPELSTGQFGEFPVYVFTSKGVYALQQGSGSVIFAAVTPVNGDVIKAGSDVTSIGAGVIYVTDEGLFHLAGQKSEEISAVMDGDNDYNLLDNAHLIYMLSTVNLVTLCQNLSVYDNESVSFMDYLAVANIGFDRVNSEIWITATVVGSVSTPYSYVFRLESKQWYKVSESYSMFINNYPELLAVDTSVIKNISDPGVTSNQVAFVTRPFSVEDEGIFSLIHRLFLRGWIATNSSYYSGLYVFGSNDGDTWQMLQGMQRSGEVRDFRLTRSHGALKYVVVVFAGRMNVSSYVKGIDIQYYNKLGGKLR